MTITNKLLWLLMGALLMLTVVAGVDIGSYVLSEHSQLPDPADARDAPLEPDTVDPSWILDGKPTFKSRIFGRSLDGGTVSGIWQCNGPGKVRWQFSLDESVYILDGFVNVEYRGNTERLGPGSTAFFPAGVTAVWDVPEHVRKAFTLSEPGRFPRHLRRWFYAYPPR